MTDLVQPQPRDLTTMSPRDLAAIPDAETPLRGTVLAGFAILALAFGGSGYWALSAKLDGAVVAPGTLVVEGNRRTVQHLDGGIVAALMVAEGDRVEAGAPLLQLDPTETDVDLTVLASQIGELTARRARLAAQIEGRESFAAEDVARELDGAVPEAQWRAAYLTQRQLFDATRRSRASEERVQAQRIAALREQIEGVEDQRASIARQTEIAGDELAGLETLFEKGLVAAPRLNGLRSELERLAGRDAALRTDRGRAENEIGTLELAALGFAEQREEAASGELAAIEAQLALVRPQYLGAVERRRRVTVTAPVSGRVVDLAVFTTGGVIRPGADILDIVPEDDALVVEARIETADVDRLTLGQETRVRLAAFDPEAVPEAYGRIVDISADRLEDERTGAPFYLARVALDEMQPEAVASLDLRPGMPAELFVRTGERTAASYLVEPLSARLSRAFAE